MLHFLLVLVLIISGCSAPAGPLQNIEVDFTDLTADGNPTETTRTITLVFSRNISGLTLDDITLEGSDSGEIEKTALTNIDTGVYTLDLRGIINSANLTVTVTKNRYIIEPPSRDVAVFYYFSPNITFENLTSDSAPGKSPGLLTLTLSDDIPDLEADDLTLSGPGTGVTKGDLTRTGSGRYTLAVSGITVSGNLYLTVEKTGFIITPPTRSVAVFGTYWDDADIQGERAFIDLSGYSGSSTLTDRQPATATPEPFALNNGITGEGMGLRYYGDRHDVTIQSYGSGGMAAQSGDYLYFYIDKPSVRSADTITMMITFFDDSTGNLGLQYVSTSGDYTASLIQKGGNNTFVTARVQLDNCNFNVGTQNYGAQFRFASAAKIQRVEIITGSMTDPAISDPPPFAPSTTLNNMIGKAVTGYQLWFNTTDWSHWKGQGPGRPGPGNVHVEMWPAGWDDYLTNGAVLHDTDFQMPDGNTARLFNSDDPQVILTHHQWMAEAGIDGSAIQRFYGRIRSLVDTQDAPSRLTRIRDAAEQTGRFFYVMYDMSHHNSNQSDVVQNIQLDWIYNVEKKGIVSSPSYAQAGGKPVVCIWGIHAIESTEGGRYPTVADTITLIQWFRSRGYYVIGGIPDDTFYQRTGQGLAMYRLFDMISPWYVGRDVENTILSGNNLLSNGLNFCHNNTRSWAENMPIDFMPTIWPGFAWTNMGSRGPPNSWPRNEGRHIWDQAREYLLRDTNNGIKSLYLAMFDEYDEATSWIKAGVDYFDIPLNQYFLTFAADGIWLSSDYYLRLARQLISVFKNKSPGAVNIGPLNQYDNGSSSIVLHSLGPVFWRNSFERRTGQLIRDGVPAIPIGHLQIDVGVPNGAVSGIPLNVTVNSAFTVNRPAVARNATSDTYTPPSTTLGMVYVPDAKSGDSAFRLVGQRTAGTGAVYRYKIADTRIQIENGMRLSYWINAAGLGTNVMVDLLLDNGAYISDSVSAQNTGTPQDGWQQRTLNIPDSLDGSFITAVIVAYMDSGSVTGNFAALIDDIVIDR